MIRFINNRLPITDIIYVFIYLYIYLSTVSPFLHAFYIYDGFDDIIVISADLQLHPVYSTMLQVAKDLTFENKVASDNKRYRQTTQYYFKDRSFHRLFATSY